MQPDALFLQGQPKVQTSTLGGVQNDIFFSVMKVIHRQPQPTPSANSDKVARLSCCCRLSELMPLVRQLHTEARARYQAQQGEQRQQAA
ncbi:hypothetical protein [Hymenobacter rubidus]|uniref:hypothetical protein n=1 Tax=Hymenobacter rubidus TaxID=1441626 RepID=UPI00191F5ABF|nr:hypothetical protein [Hymenobacter rubidus]